MPIKTKFNSTEGIVTHLASGMVSAREIIAAFEYVTVLPRYNSGMHAIWNFTDAAFEDMTHEDVAWLQHETTRLRPPWGPDFRTAFVSRSDSELQMLNLFKKMASHQPVTFGIFETIEQAVAWIKGEDG